VRAPIPTGGLPEGWQVCLPVFEGPLDLLLHLVKINQVEIIDIPVATICDQFHEYLALMEELDLDVAGEYIYEASILIQLKSRMLLPIARDEQGEIIEDPREEMVGRLLEYRRLKDAAQTLAEVHSVRRGVWTRASPELEELRRDEEGPRLEVDELSLFDLLGALRQVLDRYQRVHPLPLHLQGETFSVREQILRLVAAMEGGRPYDLLADLSSLSGRGEAIAAFLAVLEMARMGIARIHQTGSGEVLLYRTSREIRREEIEAIEG